MTPNPFQIIALIVLGLLQLLTLIALVRKWVSRREVIAWSLLWLTAGVSIAWPQLTVRLARLFGIGRGADLLLYCSVVVVMVGFLMTYVRLRRLRRDVTLLVRHLAIRDAYVESGFNACDGDRRSEPSQRPE